MPKRSPSVYDAIKRVLDFLVAAALIVVLSPVLAVIALAVLVADGRPVFFVQPRPGRGGRVFNLLKFRTMRTPKADEDALATDAVRLTPFGRLLRALSLDELPQLLNIVAGQMSFIGPRPLLVEYLPRYSAEQARRHEVRPGMTGLAQVNGRNATSWEERFAYDVEYVDNRSFMMDLMIVGKTIATVFSRTGVSSGEHATMPEFMGSDARSTAADTEE